MSAREIISTFLRDRDENLTPPMIAMMLSVKASRVRRAA